MNRKRDKVGESAAPYAAKKATSADGPTSEVKRARDADFRKAMGKVFDTHAELMRKLSR